MTTYARKQSFTEKWVRQPGQTHINQHSLIAYTEKYKMIGHWAAAAKEGIDSTQSASHLNSFHDVALDLVKSPQHLKEVCRKEPAELARKS